MFITNGKNKPAYCAHCQHVILQEQGYRYYMNRLFHDKCRDDFIQEQRRAKNLPPLLHQD